MRVRILSPDEWKDKRRGDMPPCLPYAQAGDIDFIVVEGEDGRVRACVSVLKILHLEGAWIALEDRGNAGVVNALLRAAGQVARDRGGERVIACAANGDERVPSYLNRMGGEEIGARFFALPVGG